MSKLFLVFLVILNKGSCFGSSPDLKINYERRAIEKGFPSPIVEVCINGQWGRFLLDTGAPYHVIARHFAELSAVKVETTEGNVTDSTGSTAKASFSQIPLGVRAEDGREVTFRQQRIIVVELPVSFKESGISGILSPQQLIKHGDQMLLNLSQPRMTIHPSSNLLRANQVQKWTNLEVLKIGTGEGAGILFATKAFISNYEANLIIDSGAATLEIDSASVIASKLQTFAQTKLQPTEGINGKKSESFLVPGVRTSVLGKTIETTALIHATGANKRTDGALGMHELKNCLFLITADGARGKCLKNK